MTPNEVFAMRDWLATCIYEEFGCSVYLSSESNNLAEWLIIQGWVTGKPNEDSD